MSISLGAAIYISVKPIIKIFLNIALGFILAKKKILTAETGRSISSILILALQPALIFNKIISSLDGSDLKMLGIMILGAFFQTGVGLIAGIALVLFAPCPKNWRGGLIAASTWNNAGDLPIAYVQSLATGSLFTSAESDKGVAYVTMFMAMCTVTFWNCGGFKLIVADFKTNKNNDLDLDPEEDEDEDEEEEDINHADFSPFLSIKNISSFLKKKINPKPTPNSKNVHDHHELEFEPRTKNIAIGKIPNYKSITNDDIESGRDLGLNNNIIKERSTTTNGNNQLQSRSIPNFVNNRSNSLELERRITETADNIIQNYERTTYLTSNTIIKSKSKKSLNLKHFYTIIKRGTLFFLSNLKKPMSIALIVAITLTMIPWTRRLFYKKADANLPDAPDGLPILNFVMDFTSFVGAGAVPFGLIMLGSTISNLKINSFPSKFLLTLLMLIVIKLILLPIFLILLVNQFKKIGWISKNDRLAPFVLILTGSIPTQTTNMYITSYYSPKNKKIALDCVAMALIIQYPILIITLSVVMTYTLKDVIHV